MSVYPHRSYAIKKMFADLVTGTEAYIEGLINTAYSNDLVAYTIQSGLVNSPIAPYEKSSKFWSAIQGKVKTDGTDESFKCLLATLATLPAIKHLLTRLTNLAQFGGEDVPDSTSSHPARAISGPYPGRSPSGQQSTARFDGASAAKPPEVTGTSFEKSSLADSSYRSVDSGLYCQDSAASEPESLLQFQQTQANGSVLSTSEQEVHLPHRPGLEPTVHLAAKETSSVEETRENCLSSDNLVTSGGQQLIPRVHLVSRSSTLEALINISHDVQQKEAQLIQKNEEVMEKTAECNSLREEVKRLQDKEQRFIREMCEKDKEMQCLRDEIQEKGEEIKRLKLKIADMEKENEELRMKYGAKLASLRDKQAATQKEYELTKQQFEATIMELENSRKAAEERKNDVELERAKLSEKLHVQQAHYTNEMLMHEKETSKLKEIIADREKNEERMKVQLAQERQKSAEMETQVEREKRRNAELEASIAIKQAEEEVQKRKKIEQKHRDSEIHVQDLEKEVERLQLLCSKTNS